MAIDENLLKSIESDPGITPERAALVKSIRTSQAQESQMQEKAHQDIREEGAAYTPLDQVGDVLGPAIQGTAQGLRKVGEVASKAGWAGAPVGVPALMGAESLDPETKAGKILQAASLLTPLAGKAATGLFRTEKGMGALAKGAKVLSGAPERDSMTTMKALNEGRNPFAKSIEDLNDAYAKKIPGLKSATDYIRNIVGEAAPETGDYKKLLNTAKNSLAERMSAFKSGEPLDTKAAAQDAVNIVQSGSKLLKAKEFRNSDVLRGIYQDRGDAIDLLDKLHPGFSAAHQELREAHAAESLTGWAPINKNGSPNQLRGYLNALNMSSQLGTSVMAGNPAPFVAATGLATASAPGAWGTLMRAGSKASQPIDVMGAAGEGAATVAAKLAPLFKGKTQVNVKDVALPEIKIRSKSK